MIIKHDKYILYSVRTIDLEIISSTHLKMNVVSVGSVSVITWRNPLSSPSAQGVYDGLLLTAWVGSAEYRSWIKRWRATKNYTLTKIKVTIKDVEA